MQYILSNFDWLPVQVCKQCLQIQHGSLWNIHFCIHQSFIMLRTSRKQWYHVARRARHSDWCENSFIMVVYENFFKLQSEFSKARLKSFLIDNHHKTVYGSVRSECSSPTVIHLMFLQRVRASWGRGPPFQPTRVKTFVLVFLTWIISALKDTT